MLRRSFCIATSPVRVPAKTHMSIRLVSVNQLKPFGIIRRTKVAPANKWKWSFCKQFVDLVHNPTLSLSPALSLPPSAAAFARLKIDDDVLLNPPKDKDVYEHCDIEGVMKCMGLAPVPDQALYDASPTQRTKMMNELLAVTKRYDKILDDNRRLVLQLSTARKEEQSIKRNEKKIDQCAQHFLQLCGFDDKPFKITSKGRSFTIFGKTCYSAADHYVVVTPNNDLVLVFEDKSLLENHAIPKQGHLGQIVSEMLQMLSVNRDAKLFHDVFAVRFINYRVVAFRVVTDQATLDTLCDTCEVPAKKLQLLCSEVDPLTNWGLSLIDLQERAQALQRMADIREFIMKKLTKS